MSETLRKLSAMVEIGAAELCNELTGSVHQAGMATLPDDVLADIFEQAFDATGRGDWFTNTISRVCRRYRNIALRIPHLWTFICFRERNSLKRDLGLYLARSCKKLVVVEINCNIFETIDELKEVTRVIVPALDRMEKLTIKACTELDSVRDFLLHLREEFGSVEFLALKTLCCEFMVPEWCRYDVEPDEEDTLEIDDNAKTFFESWNTPVLQTLEIANHIPLKYPVSKTSTITSLHFSLGDDISIGQEGWSQWQVESICGFLQRFEGLQELSLSFTTMELDVPDMIQVRLSGVRKLTLSIQLCKLEDLRALFEVLIFPDVEEFALFLGLDNREDMADWFDPQSAFIENLARGNITHLTLSESCLARDVSPVEEFLDRFSGLKSLSLRGEDLPLPNGAFLSSGHPLFKKLETVRIIDSEQVNASFIRFVKSLQKGHDDTLRNVQFIKCPGVDTEAVNSHIFGGKKLEWQYA